MTASERREHLARLIEAGARQLAVLLGGAEAVAAAGELDDLLGDPLPRRRVAAGIARDAHEVLLDVPQALADRGELRLEVLLVVHATHGRPSFLGIGATLSGAGGVRSVEPVSACVVRSDKKRSAVLSARTARR